MVFTARSTASERPRSEKATAAASGMADFIAGSVGILAGPAGISVQAVASVGRGRRIMGLRQPCCADRGIHTRIGAMRATFQHEEPSPTPSLPGQPGAEDRRLADLRQLGLLDTAPEETFDRLTRLA